MNCKLPVLFIILIIGCNIMNAGNHLLNVKLNTVPTSPFEDGGYGLGVSACYAGRIDHYLVMAGGCNFPTPDNKKYYNNIYIADINSPKLEWKLVGRLPKEAAYGVTISSGDSLIIIGGNNDTTNLSTVYSIHIDDDKAVVNALPSLPCTLDNAAGALCKNKLYIVGGNKDGRPSACLLSMDLDKHVWKEEAELPGIPRVQPLCVAYDEKLYIWGGFFADGLNSQMDSFGWCYDSVNRMFSMLKPPKNEKGEDLSLSGGTGILYTGCGQDKPLILCTGGVNKDIFLDAISGRYEFVERKNYLKKPVEWYKFNGNLMAYDPVNNSWKSLNHEDYSPLSRAGATLVDGGDMIYYIGGELKPSVRTPEIIGITFK